MTMRLSASSFAGTARTLVAVGTVSETFMFLTTLAAAPRRGDCVPAATGGAAVLAGLSAGLAAGAFAAGALGAGALGAGVLGAGAAVVVARGVASRGGAGESEAGAAAGGAAAGEYEAGAATGSAGASAKTYSDSAGKGF